MLQCRKSRLQQELLSVGERQGHRAALNNEWKKMRDIIFHDQQAPIRGVTVQRSLCQKLGMCVCTGDKVGRKALLFHKGLVSFARPLFTPKRQRQKPLPDGRMVPVQMTPAQQEQQAVLKGRRAVLDDGCLVFRLQHQSESAAVSEARFVHTSWSNLARRSLGQRADGSRPSTLWLHIGYVNLSTWEMAILPLCADGEPDSEGLQRLVVQSPYAAKDTVSFFSKAVDFDVSWSLQAFEIINDGRELGLDEMCPNWVLVKQMKLESAIFWRGWLQEKSKLLKSTSQQKARNVRHRMLQDLSRSKADFPCWQLQRLSRLSQEKMSKHSPRKP